MMSNPIHLYGEIAQRNMEMTIERKEVRGKPNRYRPTKAEVEEEFEPPRKVDGTSYTVNEAVRTLMRLITVVEDSEA